METLPDIFATRTLAPSFAPDRAKLWAARLGHRTGLIIYPRSFAVANGVLYFLGRLEHRGRRHDGKWLGLLSRRGVEGMVGEGRFLEFDGTKAYLQIGRAGAENAAFLRSRLEYLNPRLLGLQKSVGCGDRLGLATPGHVRAVRKHTLAPIFAQQSIREMERTGRTPQQVLDDAMWGVFQEGWRQGFGADADHLKTFEHVDRCLASGFTFYTIDPSDYVDNTAEKDDKETLLAKVETLPWPALDASVEKLRALYVGHPFDLGDFRLTLTEEDLWRAAAKYGKAIAHTVRMYYYLRERTDGSHFELEMSVDETDTPTTVAEHFYVASELKRLGVQWVSLAPRFVGRFEKGVDYIGDLDRFDASFRQHVAVARTLGPYKLSLHSGSDKFSIYPLASQAAGNLVHLKTAGTSYLVALDVIAHHDPALFREILTFARERYPIDRATYHVSADVRQVPSPETLSDEDLPRIIHEFNGRQVLHVTFGSVLTARDEHGHYKFRERLLNTLWQQEEAYSAALEAHFDRHLAPFDET